VTQITNEILGKRQQQVLYDTKWITFLKRTWVLRHIPFVDFAVAAGSMALGNVHKDSDFDVIIGAQKGRIFTVRAFSILFFGLLGWRKKKWEHDRAAKDKICLNHFVTRDSYKLSPPYNAYWRSLYMKLVPLYGGPQEISNFFIANQSWLNEKKEYGDDLRHKHYQPSKFRKALEFMLRGSLGNVFEKFQKKIQVKRIERGLKTESGYEPRVIYSDQELEFHPDTKRMLLFK
jgi:hypothetical protein